MKKNIIFIVIVLVVIAFTVLRLKSNKETTKNKVYQYNKELPVYVQADTLKLENVENNSFFSGSFEPNKETKISADIQGKINAVIVDLGSVVSKGQSLVQLDNSLLKLQLQTIEIQIEGLENDVRRYTILAQADAIQGVQLEKTELALKSAKVQRSTLLDQISKTKIKAPFAGIVTAKLTEEGAYAAPGVPLIQITDISLLKFTINVPETELSQFNMNQEYSLQADAIPTTNFSGKVVLIGSKANMGNSYPIQFSVRNTSDFKIKSGMFGKVKMKSYSLEKQIIIPASAILGSNIKPQVYIIQQGKAKLKDIKISNRIQNKVVVSSGLNENDILITSGFINVFEGANVTNN
jgi:membrane fusion protein, multidrug efflux system